MESGKLRHKVTIQRMGTRVDDETGGGSIPWNDLYADIPASIEPLSGYELLRAESYEAGLTHRVRTRFYEGIRPSDRILYGTRVFDIKRPIDPEERHRELELMCEELVTW